MAKTPETIHVASSNATTFCRLCKSVGSSAHYKILFGKANRAFVVAVEEI